MSHALAGEEHGGERCTFCRERFHAGAGLFGGLGSRYAFGLRGTSQYAAPALAWVLPSASR